jgi:hypothetical protein
VLGLSFYPLEQASKHGDLCNEQIRDSNERSNLSCGFCSPKRLLQTRAVAAKKFICGLAGVISVAPLLEAKWGLPGRLRGSRSLIFSLRPKRILENPDRFAIRLTEQISSIGLFAVPESQCTEDEHDDEAEADSKFSEFGLNPGVR